MFQNQVGEQKKGKYKFYFWKCTAHSVMKLLHEFVFASPDVGDIVAATDMVNDVQTISFLLCSLGSFGSLTRFFIY